MLNGKKTYLIAVLIIIYAVAFRGLGANDWNTALGMISTALIGMSLRDAISSSPTGLKL